mgnify:CR=1 FL=1
MLLREGNFVEFELLNNYGELNKLLVNSVTVLKSKPSKEKVVSQVSKCIQSSLDHYLR